MRLIADCVETCLRTYCVLSFDRVCYILLKRLTDNRAPLDDLDRPGTTCMVWLPLSGGIVAFICPIWRMFSFMLDVFSTYTPVILHKISQRFHCTVDHVLVDYSDRDL